MKACMEDKVIRGLLMLLLTPSCSLWAQSTSWSGSASNDWFDSANWTNGVPVASGQAVIAPGNAEIAQAGQVAEADFITLGNGFNRGGLEIRNGATLRTGGIQFSGLDTVSVDGGILEFTQNNAVAWQPILLGPGQRRFIIGAGGLTLDSGEGLAALNAELTGSGTLVKTGSGALEYVATGGGYTGTIEVQEGFLVAETNASFHLTGGRLGLHTATKETLLSTITGSQGTVQFSGGGLHEVLSEQTFSGEVEVVQGSTLTIGDGKGAGALPASVITLRDESQVRFLGDDDWETTVKGTAGTIRQDAEGRLSLTVDESDAPEVNLGLDRGQLTLGASNVPVALSISGGVVAGSGTIGNLSISGTGVRISNVVDNPAYGSGLTFSGPVNDGASPWTFVFSNGPSAAPFRATGSFTIPDGTTVELQGSFPPGSHRLLQAENGGSIDVATGLPQPTNAAPEYFHAFYREPNGLFLDLVVMDADYFDWYFLKSWGDHHFGPDANPDHDLLSNNLERYLNRDPLVADFEPALTRFEVTDVEGVPGYILEYDRLAGATGVYLIGSKDLQTWRVVNGYAGGMETVIGTSGGGGGEGDLDIGGEPLVESIRVTSAGIAADFQFFAFTDDRSVITPYLIYGANYLSLPVGTVINVPSFQLSDGRFITAVSEIRVMEVVSISGGRASLDVDGSGTAATATQYVALGITDQERDAIAAEFPANSSFYRFFGL